MNCRLHGRRSARLCSDFGTGALAALGGAWAVVWNAPSRLTAVAESVLNTCYDYVAARIGEVATDISMDAIAASTGLAIGMGVSVSTDTDSALTQASIGALTVSSCVAALINSHKKNHGLQIAITTAIGGFAGWGTAALADADETSAALVSASITAILTSLYHLFKYRKQHELAVRTPYNSKVFTELANLLMRSCLLMTAMLNALYQDPEAAGYTVVESPRGFWSGFFALQALAIVGHVVDIILQNRDVKGPLSQWVHYIHNAILGSFIAFANMQGAQLLIAQQFKPGPEAAYRGTLPLAILFGLTRFFIIQKDLSTERKFLVLRDEGVLPSVSTLPDRPFWNEAHGAIQLSSCFSDACKRALNNLLLLGQSGFEVVSKSAETLNSFQLIVNLTALAVAADQEANATLFRYTTPLLILIGLGAGVHEQYSSSIDAAKKAFCIRALLYFASASSYMATFLRTHGNVLWTLGSMLTGPQAIIGNKNVADLIRDGELVVPPLAVGAFMATGFAVGYANSHQSSKLRTAGFEHEETRANTVVVRNTMQSVKRAGSLVVRSMRVAPANDLATVVSGSNPVVAAMPRGSMRALAATAAGVGSVAVVVQSSTPAAIELTGLPAKADATAAPELVNPFASTLSDRRTRALLLGKGPTPVSVRMAKC